MSKVEEKVNESTTSSTTRTVFVTDTNRFRSITLFGSLILGISTLILMYLDPRKCDIVKLEMAMYVCAGVHLTTFFVLLLSYLFPKCMNAIGHWMSIFYVSLIGAMIVV